MCALACALVGALALPSVSAADDPGSAEAGGGASTAAKVVVLRKGDRGPAVRKLQRRLGIGADGAFGANTRRAVKRFQRGRGLTADGIVGPLTRRALGLKAFARESVHRRGSKKRKRSRGSGSARRTLERIAECESGGDPAAVSGSGRYRGKYQFSRATWAAQGGEGRDPAKADEAEQDRVALKLYRSEGLDPWPVCGKKNLG